MVDNSKKTTWARVKDFIRGDLWLLILDIAAVNLSYFLALILRFYVNNAFRVTAFFYLEYYGIFAPFYTVICILIFFLFRLYGGMWRYAGLNDMNRITLANLCTVVVQVVGSILTIRIVHLEYRDVSRMPYAYYVLGALFQYMMMLASRYSYRLFMAEKSKIVDQSIPNIPVIVVGSGELGYKAVRHLENNTPYQVVAVVGNDHGHSMDGIPIIPVSALQARIREKNVQLVFIADQDLSHEAREAVSAAAEGLEVKDFTGYYTNQFGYLPVSLLLDVVQGPVTIVVDGQEQRYENASDCLATLTKQYDVVGIDANRIELRENKPDIIRMTDYIDQNREQQGEELSFF